MLFLDANIFYSYFGRPKLGMTSEPIDPNALRCFLDSRTDKSLPSSVIGNLKPANLALINSI